MKKLFCLLVVFILLTVPIIRAGAVEAGQVVIGEFKTSGGTGKSTDEFVELYNPTDIDVSLNDWQLIKKTASGNDYVLVDNFGEKIISAHSFFLITHPAGYLGEVAPDFYYSTTNSISDNNSIVLYDPSLAVADAVGYGTATVFETEAAANPPAGKSLERQARSDSTKETMVEGGAHYF
jgi:predicted extracellular nuclease